MFLPRFQPSPSQEEDRLWCGFTSTLRQTRSGSGDAKASGQDLPLSRAFFESLLCCPQARFRTFPGYQVPGTRGQSIWCFEIGGQKRGIEVALDGANATGTLVPPLRKRLLDLRSAAMTKL